MAPSGSGTIAQVCTLEYCHPANGNKGQKQDHPSKSTSTAGKVAKEKGKGSCEMLIELRRVTYRPVRPPHIPLPCVTRPLHEKTGCLDCRVQTDDGKRICHDPDANIPEMSLTISPSCDTQLQTNTE